MRTNVARDAAPVIDTLVAPTPRGGRILRCFSEANQEKIILFFENPLSIAGLVLVLGWVVVAVFAYIIAPYPEHAEPWVDAFHGLEPPSAEHWFGTDKLGRDIFSRLLIGSRISLTSGVIPVLLSLLVGVPLGILAGMHRGTTETLIMRSADSLLAMPRLLLAIAISAALGPSLMNAMLAVSVVGWPYYARLSHSQTLSLKEEQFVEAARGLGVSNSKIMIRHILPNIMPSIIVRFTMSLGFGILTMASLSFVGMGAQPPSPEWGLAINEGRQYMPTYWWLTLFHGLAIFTVVLGFNLVGDGLRDALDPRRRK